MSQFNNIQELLDDFKDNVIREAKSNLKTKGNLNSSLKGYVKESKNSIQISFEMESYGAFVDRFENKLAGWTMTTDILIPNGMTIC